MTTSKILATKVIKAITSFLSEFEGAKTKPNLVFLTKEQRDSINKHFPYYFNKEGKFVHNKQAYDIITTDKNIVGVAFSFYTNYIEDYE